MVEHAGGTGQGPGNSWPPRLPPCRQNPLPCGTAGWQLQLSSPKGAFSEGGCGDGAQLLLALPSELCPGFSRKALSL